MRLILCGKSFVASGALTYAVGNGIKTVCVATKGDDGVDTWEPSLRATAARLGVDCVGHHRDACPGADDVLVSLEYDRIVKTTALDCRCYNIHFSNLPKYRGCHTSVWPIRNGELVAGVTLHEMTDGIDDGPIISQFLFSLRSDWTAYDLYLAYHRHAIEMFKRDIWSLMSGDYQANPQDEKKATYYNRASIDYTEKEILGRGLTGAALRNYARSLAFPPYQMPTMNGRPMTGDECLRL